MAFEGLRDRVKEAWAETAAKILESSLFNQLREKYEEQTPTVQKAVGIGSLALVALVALSFPLGYLSTSRDNVAQFEENRALIQGLLRAARSAKEPSPLPPPVSGPSLKGVIERVFKDNQIPPDQIAEVNVMTGVPAANLAPPAVQQSGVVAHLKQLTITQIVDVANAMANVAAGTKLIGLDVTQTTGQTHYYDINLKVVNFGLPTIAGAEPEAAPRGGRPARGGQTPPATIPAGDEGGDE